MFATNAKNSHLGRLGSGLGDLALFLPPSYDNLIRAHPAIAHYWPLFNKKTSATIEVDPVGGMTATYTGTPTDATTFIGEGATVFASGQFMSTPAINIARGAVEFWCKITTNPVTGTNKGLMVGLVDSSSVYDKVVYLNADNTMTFAIQKADGTIQTVTTVLGIVKGRWNHICCIQDSSNGLTFYVNGLLVKSTGVATSASRVDLTVGGWIAGDGSTLGFVDVPGTYCNVALYSGDPALTATDVLNHYNAGATGFATSKARVTQVVSEVLRDATARKARVTQVVVEVLRSSSIATSTYNVSGTTNLALPTSAAKTRSAPSAASTNLALPTSAGRTRGAAASSTSNLALASPAVGARAVSSVATSNLALVSPGSSTRTVSSSATSTIAFVSPATDTRTTSSSAASTLAFAPVGSGNRPGRNLPVDAAVSLAFVSPSHETAAFSIGGSGSLITSHLTLSWAGGEVYVPYVGVPYSVSGSANLALSGVGSEHRTQNFAVSASSSIVVDAACAVGIPPQIFPVSGLTQFNLAGVAGEGAIRTYNVNAASEIRFLEFADPVLPNVWTGHAISSFSLEDQSSEINGRTIAVSASSSFGVRAFRSAGRKNIYPVNATRGFTLTDLAKGIGVGIKSVSVMDSIAFATQGGEVNINHFPRSASSSFIVSGAAAENTGFAAFYVDDVTFTAQPNGGRGINVHAVTGLGLGGGTGDSYNHLHVAGVTALALHDAAATGVDHLGAEDHIVFGQVADGQVVADTLAADTSNQGGGPANILLSNISGDFPNSYAETPAGLLLIANGIDPMIRWDGLAALATTAGMIAPTQAVQLGGTGFGSIVGRRVAYIRFLDADGNVSNFSPVSNLVDFGRDAGIDFLWTDPATGLVTIRSDGHGLVGTDSVVISGCDGNVSLNGLQTITVIDENQFTVQGIVSSGAYQGGGSWTWGVETIVYQSLACPTDTSVARRQILRSLDGDASTFYIDIDTTDLTSTVLMSEADDATLAGGGAVPLFFDDDLPCANRYTPPPSHKAVLASHLGRIFATADVTYTKGSAACHFGSNQVVGADTQWRATFAGRRLYVSGARASYEIASVDEVNQVITLTAAYGDRTDRFASYAIRPAPGERKLVYYSEPSLPEAWPPWNAIAVPEDSDDITGLLVKGSFLYVLERRHIYRFTFQNDPARDGYIFLSTGRGAVNNRCVVQVEDNAYMLDETGIHSFDGGQSSTPISGPIQNLFQQDGAAGFQVDWSADQTLWHAAHDPVRDTIRWFVHFVGDSAPVHALCYDYRLQRWWIEAYATPITASAVATVGYRRSIVGTTARQVLCLSEGSLDGVAAQDGLRGSATDGSATTLVDSRGGFPAGLGGVPLAIVDGTCKGQTRVIATSSSTTLEVVEPWDDGDVPDTSTIYQVGGVPWTWRSGWFRHAEDESDNPRDIDVVFQPLLNPATLDVSIYYDHSDVPQVWSYTRADDGVSVVEGQSEIAVDLTTVRGYATYRLKGHNDRYALGEQFVSVGLSGVQAGEVVRVFQVGVNGARGEK